MKIELVKKTTTAGHVYYWVMVNDSSTNPSQVFSYEENARDYYNQLKAHYAQYGSFDEKLEILSSETL